MFSVQRRVKKLLPNSFPAFLLLTSPVLVDYFGACRLLTESCTRFDKLSMNGFSSAISTRTVRPELRRRMI
jgi:hypothetical protein